jgi:hypothetical protein
MASNIVPFFILYFSFPLIIINIVSIFKFFIYHVHCYMLQIFTMHVLWVSALVSHWTIMYQKSRLTCLSKLQRMITLSLNSANY